MFVDPDSNYWLMKVKDEWSSERPKDSKEQSASEWRKTLKTEKTQYIYRTAEEVIEESKHLGQKKKKFKWICISINFFMELLHYFF